MSEIQGLPSGATSSAHLFLECDRDGRIIWMSDRALARLGQARNLLDHLPEARRLLSDLPSPAMLPGAFARTGGTHVPVRMSRILSSENRVVLAAEVRERASDRHGEELEELARLERAALRKYFRLLPLQRYLESRRPARRDLGPPLSARLEKERRRIARELHSGAGQALAGIKIHTELLQLATADASANVRSSVSKIGLLAQDALTQVRAVSHRLHPPEWQRMGLREALENLWIITGIPEGFEADLQLGPLTAEPPQEVRVMLYRAVQEALSNVVRHSGATRVRLSLGEEQGRIRLSVEDNGKGFDPERLGAAAGIGLRATRDDVRGVGGEFTINSGPNGTKLEISFPVARE